MRRMKRLIIGFYINKTIWFKASFKIRIKLYGTPY